MLLILVPRLKSFYDMKIKIRLQFFIFKHCQTNKKIKRISSTFRLSRLLINSSVSSFNAPPSLQFHRVFLRLFKTQQPKQAYASRIFWNLLYYFGTETTILKDVLIIFSGLVISSMPKCANKGCGKEYEQQDNTDASCQYHPGNPVSCSLLPSWVSSECIQIFHEGLKSWSCCSDTNRPVLDFESFMAISVCLYIVHE